MVLMKAAALASASYCCAIMACNPTSPITQNWALYELFLFWQKNNTWRSKYQKRTKATSFDLNFNWSNAQPLFMLREWHQNKTNTKAIDLCHNKKICQPDCALCSEPINTTEEIGKHFQLQSPTIPMQLNSELKTFPISVKISATPQLNWCTEAHC